MMKSIALTSALVAMTACIQVPDFRGGGSNVEPAPAAVQMTAKERLIVAAEGHNCLIDPATIQLVLADANLSVDDLRTVVPELEAEGRIVGAGETSLRVISANCPAV
jgi:hypothetical protein